MLSIQTSAREDVRTANSIVLANTCSLLMFSMSAIGLMMGLKPPETRNTDFPWDCRSSTSSEIPATPLYNLFLTLHDVNRRWMDNFGACMSHLETRRVRLGKKSHLRVELERQCTRGKQRRMIPQEGVQPRSGHVHHCQSCCKCLLKLHSPSHRTASKLGFSFGDLESPSFAILQALQEKWMDGSGRCSLCSHSCHHFTDPQVSCKLINGLVLTSASTGL